MPDNRIQRSYSGLPELYSPEYAEHSLEKRYQRYYDPIHGFYVNLIGSGTEQDPYLNSNISVSRDYGFYPHAILVYVILRYVMENKLETRYLKIGEDLWVIKDNGNFHILSKAFPNLYSHYSKVVSEVERLFSEG